MKFIIFHGLITIFPPLVPSISHIFPHPKKSVPWTLFHVFCGYGPIFHNPDFLQIKPTISSLSSLQCFWIFLYIIHLSWYWSSGKSINILYIPINVPHVSLIPHSKSHVLPWDSPHFPSISPGVGPPSPPGAISAALSSSAAQRRWAGAPPHPGPSVSHLSHISSTFDRGYINIQT